MQVSVENTGALERKLTVSVPADRLEGQVRDRLRELSRNVRLKGFRPGKVPAKVIEQRYGQQVRSEAMGELIRESFSEAVEQEKLRPAMAPSIETTGQPADGEITYVATFEVMPEIGTIDVSAMDIVKPVADVADADIDEMIETLRVQRRSWNPVERAAAAGDLVMFESVAETEQGRVPKEGTERAGTIIGSNAIFTELEQSLVGLSAGEERTVEVSFPAEYRVAALAGQAAKITVKAVRVSEAQLPEVDEAFMQSFGVTEGGLERFREEVRANLRRELRAALMARLKADVVQKLVDAHAAVEFPARMIDAEARAMARQAEQQARQQGKGEAKLSPDTFRDSAAQRVAAAVLLGEIARQNGIKLDSSRVAETLAAIASTYEEPEQVVELYRNDPQLMSGLQSRVLEDQVIDWIADHAHRSDKTLTFAEVMRPGGASA
jgi:trigger factor